ncbi:WbqC family protein [Roseibium sediminis]|uniref:WbqC family protein n=1 Tax=Roseibium sediminis TaxID=1775174 RepID=UPI00123DCC9F|nr:WbqC family protein [Roseibium sediminis]
MRVGVIQSSFIPWRGYFDFIASVDLFVFHDDIQYTKGDWRNRNRLKTPEGLAWLTVPVHYQKVAQLICETGVAEVTDWRAKHIALWKSNYRSAPNLVDVFDIMGDLEQNTPDLTISQLNTALIRRICSYLGIPTPLVHSADLALVGAKTERLIDLCRKVGATTYLSGPKADAYLDKDAFRKHGIALEYKSYDYPPYPQLWGDFDGAVTVLDLIANCGAGATQYLRSRTPDQVVVP